MPIGRLDGKIVVSEACIGSLSRYFPYDYTVIPNGIDDRHFTPDADPVPELSDGRRNILFLGRFDPRNGLGTMIDAFARVRREWGPEVRLVVVGDGPLRSFYQKRIPAQFADDVHWAGRVNWHRPSYYTAADIHCTPCSRASFGMVLLEAMSCGRPVVASRISGFQLVMEHGRHGLMISPADDADRFAEGLLYLPRPSRRARAHGPRGAAHRRHALLVDAHRRAARATYYVSLLRGASPRRRRVTKRQVLVRYVGLAVLAAALVAVVDLTLVALGLGWLAWLLDVAYAVALVLLTWGAFAANSPLFGRVVNGATVTQPVVAITFDDGPSPDITPLVLDALRTDGARATFFVLGKHAERTPTWSSAWSRGPRGRHARLRPLHPDVRVAREIARQLLRTDAILRRLGVPPCGCSARPTASATRS